MSTLRDRYRAWLKTHNDVGCVFAKVIAVNPLRHLQHAEELSGGNPSLLAADAAQRIDRLVADPNVAAATLVFPESTTLLDLVEFALALEGHSSWGVTRSVLEESPIGKALAFGITREIPFQGRACPSEALVLGPFAEFPNTRKAPTTVLEMFVGVPPPTTPKGHVRAGAHMKANLADMELQVPSSRALEFMWERSKELRLQSLGGREDERAKAKVAFSIPFELATSLGCVP